MCTNTFLLTPMVMLPSSSYTRYITPTPRPRPTLTFSTTTKNSSNNTMILRYLFMYLLLCCSLWCYANYFGFFFCQHYLTVDTCRGCPNSSMWNERKVSVVDYHYPGHIMSHHMAIHFFLKSPVKICIITVFIFNGEWQQGYWSALATYCDCMIWAKRNYLKSAKTKICLLWLYPFT